MKPENKDRPESKVSNLMFYAQSTNKLLTLLSGLSLFSGKDRPESKDRPWKQGQTWLHLNADAPVTSLSSLWRGKQNKPRVYELVRQLVFWAQSTTKGYIGVKQIPWNHFRTNQ